MDSFKLTLNQFFRYVYGGFLLCLIGAVIDADAVKQIIAALGPVLAPLAVIAVGTGVYVFYRLTIGEKIDHIHLQWHSKDSCVFKYLNKVCGVKKENRIMAFRIIRDSKFLKEDVRNLLEIRHAEMHVTYLTFTLCFASILYLLVNKFSFHRIIILGENNLIIIFSLISILSIFLGFWADLRLCNEERQRIKNIYKEHQNEINKLLQEI